MNITQLIVYPVKSLKGIDVTQSELNGHGLAWELTDQALVLSHPNGDPIAIPLADPQGNLRLVKVWNDHCKAMPESEDVSHWLVAALGEQAQGISLVRFASEFTRPVEEDFLAGGEAHTYFADGYPFLITTTGSLDALNQALVANGQSPVPMNRFRPNIVVECESAWVEDQWATIAGQSGYELTLRKPCQRCKITTVDQQTGTVPQQAEPLKTLLSLNTQPHLKGAHFGQNATLTTGQGSTIRVGDEVVPTRRAT